jgi:ribosomal-protein-alanine N-acetyltransferase
VHLRRPGPGDGRAFVAAARASYTLHRPWAYPPDTPEAYAAYLERLAQPAFDGFLVCRTGDGAVVGCINVNNIVRGALQSAHLGYAGFAPFAGAGYMTEGLRLVVDAAFDDLGLHRVEANIQPGNDRSRALARRCGFRLEGYSPRYLQLAGEWRDHERWALTAEDRQR